MNDFVQYCYDKFERTIVERNLFADVKQFLVLYSFGKDCTMMLDLFLKYYDKHHLDIPFSVFSVPYPLHMYYSSDGVMSDEVNTVIEYWKNRDIDIIIHPTNCADIDFNDKYGCKTCKTSRKPILDNYINSCQENTGVLTGFTIYDALAYLTMVQLICDYDVSKLYNLQEPLRSNTSKMLHKMSLREYLPNGKYFIRPMLPFNEQDIQRYVNSIDIPYATKSCEISKFKFKRLLSKGLDLYDDFPVTYEGIENYLKQNGISLNDEGLSFEDVESVNFYVDC